MSWRKAVADLKIIRWIVGVLNKFKVLPQYLPIVSTILSATQTVIERWVNYVVTSNQKKSDEIIKKEEVITQKVEEERAKPLPQQNNDVLRDQLRNRHKQ